MSDTDGRTMAMQKDFEYGSGGRKITMLKEDPGVCEGTGAEVAAGTFKVNTKGPSDISWSDSDSGL